MKRKDGRKYTKKYGVFLVYAIMLGMIVELSSCKAYDFPADAFPLYQEGGSFAESEEVNISIHFFMQGTQDIKEILDAGYKDAFNAFKSVASSKSFEVQNANQRFFRFDVETREAGASYHFVYDLTSNQIGDIVAPEFYTFNWYAKQGESRGASNYDPLKAKPVVGGVIIKEGDFDNNVGEPFISKTIGLALERNSDEGGDINVFFTNLREFGGQIDSIGEKLIEYINSGNDSLVLFAFKEGSSPFFVIVTGKTELLVSYSNAALEVLKNNGITDFEFTIISNPLPVKIVGNERLKMSELDNALEALSMDYEKEERTLFEKTFESTSYYHYYILDKNEQHVPFLQFYANVASVSQFGRDYGDLDKVESEYLLSVIYSSESNINMKSLESIDAERILGINAGNTAVTSVDDGMIKIDLRIDKKELKNLDYVGSMSKPKFTVNIKVRNEFKSENWLYKYNEFIPGFEDMFNMVKKQTKGESPYIADFTLFFILR